MFYNTKIFLMSILVAFMAQISFDANAQGVVSLSEEAMEDDEEDNVGAVIPKGPNAVMPKGPNAVVPKGPNAVVPKGPNAVMPKGPDAAMPKGPAAQETSDSAETNNDPFAGQGFDFDSEDDKSEKEKELNESGIVDKSKATAADLIEEEKAIDSDLFSQMSDLEKRTALLNLELRKEKLQNEIEAIKNKRQQAIVEEEERKKALELKAIKEKQDMEKELLAEQEKLRLLDIEFEKLRQETLLSNYKNKMLEERQQWIAENANFYKTIKSLSESNKKIAADAKSKMETIREEAEKAKKSHDEQIGVYRKQIKDQNSQLSVLRNRIARLERERDAMAQNPFASASGGAAVSQVASTSADGEEVTLEPVKTDLALSYIVTEIRGQGNELIAKLYNKVGNNSFYVKKGTVLQTGHVISEIASTHVIATKDGEKSYLYFSAGGILPAELKPIEVNTPES